MAKYKKILGILLLLNKCVYKIKLYFVDLVLWNIVHMFCN